ncbi:MAG TPA: hypothetical protein VFP87_00560 [Chitinophagaceae bacterium]|nr:hypothetical protein [Chitinophagaceae bacterium]
MKYFYTVSLLLAICTACKQKELSGAQLDDRLIKTMQSYLDKNAKPGVTYAVKDVTYYADKDKKMYNCEFHVEMRTEKEKIDTTGLMKANIPNDFSKVERIQ